MINIQPTLIGNLVRLRPLVAEDFQALALAASDKKIWEQHPDPRRCQKQYFYKNYFVPALNCKGALAFQSLKNNSKVIGCSRYYHYRPETKDITIGYTFISRQCWGSTFNRQIKHLMMTHIYQYVDTIYFLAGIRNIRSQTAMAKIGGILLNEQQIKSRKIPTNQSVVFQIKKENFKGLI